MNSILISSLHMRSLKKISFLDLVIKVTDVKIVTDLYCKPTDGHQYLHYSLCHAEHIKTSINLSQTLRLKRICYQTCDLDSPHVKELELSSSYFTYYFCLAKGAIQRK